MVSVDSWVHEGWQTSWQTSIISCISINMYIRLLLAANRHKPTLCLQINEVICITRSKQSIMGPERQWDFPPNSNWRRWQTIAIAVFCDCHWLWSSGAHDVTTRGGSRNSLRGGGGGGGLGSRSVEIFIYWQAKKKPTTLKWGFKPPNPPPPPLDPLLTTMYWRTSKRWYREWAQIFTYTYDYRTFKSFKFLYFLHRWYGDCN